MDIDELLGRRAVGIDNPEDYIAWAIAQLVTGSDSRKIAILAGLGLEKPVDNHEVQAYFLKSCEDLGINVPEKKSALRGYAESVCHRITNGGISTKDGLVLLARLYSASEYSEGLYSIWDELEEDVSALDTDYGPIFNSGLTVNNVDQYIKNVALQFQALLRIELPTDFFELAYCSSCETIRKPASRRIDLPWLPERLYRIIHRRGPAFSMVCGQCGSKKIQHMHDYEARKMYLHQTNGANIELRAQAGAPQ